MINKEKWKPCLYCGKLIRNYKERKYCSFKCKHADKQYWKNRENKSNKKWGAPHYLKSKLGKRKYHYVFVENSKKAAEKQKEKYNGKYRFQTEEFKEYCIQLNLRKRGVKYLFQDENFKKNTKNKRINTLRKTLKNKSKEQKDKENKSRSISCKKAYYSKTNEQIKQIYNKVSEKKKEYWKNLSIEEKDKVCKNISIAISNYMNNRNKKQINDFVNKVFETRKRNGTLGSCRSKAEIRCYDKIKSKYQDTEHSYFKDSRYPFNCDIYIPSQDLFIECHFSQYHHYKPFDKNCIGDLAELSRLNHIINSPYFTNDYKKEYIDIIKTWTITDPKKLKTFIDNKLNYKIFYTEKEFNKWFTNL